MVTTGAPGWAALPPEPPAALQGYSGGPMFLCTGASDILRSRPYSDNDHWDFRQADGPTIFRSYHPCIHATQSWIRLRESELIHEMIRIE